MISNRWFLIAACTAPLLTAACGGSESDDDEEELPTPAGTHYGYVVSKVEAIAEPPRTGSDYGLDLGSPRSSDLNGTIDNQIGAALVALQSASMIDLRGEIDAAIDTGALILLADFQTTDFASAPAAGFGVKIGANAMPAPCTDATDTACRKHLGGNASFTISASSPTDVVIAGKVAGNTFNGGPGNVVLQLPVGDAPITLDLKRARVKATAISDTKMTATIGGLIPEAELETTIGPALVAQINVAIADNCDAVRPNCTCTGNTRTLLEAVDKNPKDCAVTAQEIFAHPLLTTFLQADSCTEKSCSAPNALSIGLRVELVKATFPL